MGNRSRKKRKSLMEKKRDRLLCRAISDGLSLAMIQDMLSLENLPTLYPRFRRDSIIIWGIYHNITVSEINKIIKRYGCKKMKITSGKKTKVKHKS